MSAARHRLLSALLEDLPAKGILFPGLTSKLVNAFIRSQISMMPPGFVPGAHGARVAADTEALELGAPQSLLDIMGWWKQEKRRMSDYYSGTNVQRMFALTELYGFISFIHLAPGFYDLVDPPAGTVRPRFEEPALLETRPKGWQEHLPDLSESLVIDHDSSDDELPAHAIRCSNIRSRLQAMIGLPTQTDRKRPSTRTVKQTKQSDPSDDGSSDSSTFSTDCADCNVHISRGSSGALCDTLGCKYTLCSRCHPVISRSLQCPAHQPRGKRLRLR
jgi:hypothetical protein